MKLTREDEGRQIKIWIHPDQDPIAAALGAGKVEVCGKIVWVGEDYVEIDVDGRTTLSHVNHGDLKKIKFSAIKKIELFAK